MKSLDEAIKEVLVNQELTGIEILNKLMIQGYSCTYKDLTVILNKFPKRVFRTGYRANTDILYRNE